MGKSIIASNTGGGGNEPQGREGKTPKLVFFKFFSKLKFSVSDKNNFKSNVGWAFSPTMKVCWGRNPNIHKNSDDLIGKKSINSSPCHAELAAPLVADEKEAYKGGCSQSNSGSSHRQKCSAICTQKFNVGLKAQPTLISVLPRRRSIVIQGLRHYSPRRVAFTLAEVLITLGIIGVVAAMTLPVLTGHYRKSVVESRLKKFYSTMNQVILMSERDNGPKEYWDAQPKAYDIGEDGTVDKTQESKMISWFNRYIKPYIVTLDTNVDINTSQGKVNIFFPDGSLVIIGESSWIFYPEAKYYKITESLDTDGYVDVDPADSGIRYFTFLFNPSKTVAANKFHYKKGVEPYKYKWDGNKSSLLNDSELGCKETVSDERAYCTALIQLNGWNIPDNYPFKF